MNNIHDKKTGTYVAQIIIRIFIPVVKRDKLLLLLFKNFLIKHK